MLSIGKLTKMPPEEREINLQGWSKGEPVWLQLQVRYDIQEEQSWHDQGVHCGFSVSSYLRKKYSNGEQAIKMSDYDNESNEIQMLGILTKKRPVIGLTSWPEKLDTRVGMKFNKCANIDNRKGPQPKAHTQTCISAREWKKDDSYGFMDFHRMITQYTVLLEFIFLQHACINLFHEQSTFS